MYVSDVLFIFIILPPMILCWIWMVLIPDATPRAGTYSRWNHTEMKYYIGEKVCQKMLITFVLIF